MNNQDEMFERATETPIGEVKVEGAIERSEIAEGLREQRNVPLAHFPPGADGTEPAPKKRSEVEKLNEILFERIGEIVRKCCAMRVECDPEHVDYDAAETNIKLFGAFSELRQMCDFYTPREKPVDPTAPEMKKEFKFGLLSNGVQMIRFASGPTVQLIGKRERGPHERNGGKTGKVIYKVMLSRESHSAEVIVDGVCKLTLLGKSNGFLEHAGLAMLNCIIAFNARQQRHKKARYNRRKAEAKKQ